MPTETASSRHQTADTGPIHRITVRVTNRIAADHQPHHQPHHRNGPEVRSDRRERASTLVVRTVELDRALQPFGEPHFGTNPVAASSFDPSRCCREMATTFEVPFSITIEIPCSRIFFARSLSKRASYEAPAPRSDA